MAELWNHENQKWDTVPVDHDGTKALINGEFVPAYVSTYNSVGGPKAVLMSWDEECGMYTPWNTWFGAKDMDSAWKDALSWAMAEEIPAIRNAA